MSRLRLAILGDSPCSSCVAACCKRNGHEYAALLEGDERRRFAAFALEVPIAHGGLVVVERVLPYRDDGRCVFLGEDDRCTIYADRPAACRRFQCVSGYHLGGRDVTGHSEFLRRNPAVLARLEAM